MTENQILRNSRTVRNIPLQELPGSRSVSVTGSYILQGYSELFEVQFPDRCSAACVRTWREFWWRRREALENYLLLLSISSERAIAESGGSNTGIPGHNAFLDSCIPCISYARNCNIDTPHLYAFSRWIGVHSIL